MNETLVTELVMVGFLVLGIMIGSATGDSVVALVVKITERSDKH
jgi:hypothetical protein